MIRKIEFTQLQAGDIICLACVQYFLESPHKEIFWLPAGINIEQVTHYMLLNHGSERKFRVHALEQALKKHNVQASYNIIQDRAVQGVVCDIVLSANVNSNSWNIQTLFSGMISVSMTANYALEGKVIILC